MFQISFQGYGNDFHIIVVMCAKAHPRSDLVIVQYPQGTKVHSFRVVVLPKTEGVPGLQPTMVGIPSCFGLM
jgi:hypothetical protein